MMMILNLDLALLILIGEGKLQRVVWDFTFMDVSNSLDKQIKKKTRISLNFKQTAGKQPFFQFLNTTWRGWKSLNAIKSMAWRQQPANNITFPAGVYPATQAPHFIFAIGRKLSIETLLA